MRSRFLVSLGVSDVVALLISGAVASWITFGSLLPPATVNGQSTLPMIGFMVGSMVVMSVATARMPGPGVPRPTYGRMVAIGLGTVALTAFLLVLFRGYFSRSFLLQSGVGWLILATSHRLVRRRRPWTENLGLITSEKKLADDLADSEHASVKWVLAPDFDGVPDPPDRDVTIAVDLRSVLITTGGLIPFVVRHGRLSNSTLHLSIRIPHRPGPAGSSQRRLGDIGSSSRGGTLASGQANIRRSFQW